MSIMNKLRGTMDSHLAGMPGVPPIAPQNVAFQQPVNTPYLKTTLVPTSTRPAIIGPNPQLRYDGIYSILICTPEGVGSGSAYDLADDILERFAASSDITFDGINVSINYTEVHKSYFEAPWYCTPVNVAWYIYN